MALQRAHAPDLGERIEQILRVRRPSEVVLGHRHVRRDFGIVIVLHGLLQPPERVCDTASSEACRSERYGLQRCGSGLLWPGGSASPCDMLGRCVCVCVLSAGGPPPGLITRAAGSPSDAWYCCVLNCSAACCASSDAWPPPLAMAEGPPARAPLAAPRKGHLHPQLPPSRSSGGASIDLRSGLFRFGNKMLQGQCDLHSQAGASD